MALLAFLEGVRHELVDPNQRHSSKLLAQGYRNGFQLQIVQLQENRDNTTYILELLGY